MIEFHTSTDPAAQHLMTLCLRACDHLSVEEFGNMLLAQLVASENFTDVQKMAFQIALSRYSGAGKLTAPLLNNIFQFILYDGWPVAGVSVGALNAAQREGIMLALVAVAQQILLTEAAQLTALANVTPSLPANWEEEV